MLFKKSIGYNLIVNFGIIPTPMEPLAEIKLIGNITLDELIKKGLNLVTYAPRYSDGNCGVFIGGNLGNLVELAMMADGMTDSGDYCQHIEHMLFDTPYFPWGEGATFQIALNNAMARVNQFTREDWFDYAYYVVAAIPGDYPAIREAYINWPPYPSIAQLKQI